MIDNIDIVASRQAALRILGATAQESLLLLRSLIDVGSIGIWKKDFVLSMAKSKGKRTEVGDNIRGMMDVVEVYCAAWHRG